MTEERLPALGQPDEEPTPDADHDFAGEHADTAVDPAITTDADGREPETPRGWSGMESDGPP